MTTIPSGRAVKANKISPFLFNHHSTNWQIVKLRSNIRKAVRPKAATLGVEDERSTTIIFFYKMISFDIIIAAVAIIDEEHYVCKQMNFISTMSKQFPLLDQSKTASTPSRHFSLTQTSTQTVWSRCGAKVFMVTWCSSW